MPKKIFKPLMLFIWAQRKRAFGAQAAVAGRDNAFLAVSVGAQHEAARPKRHANEAGFIWPARQKKGAFRRGQCSWICCWICIGRDGAFKRGNRS